MDGSNDPPPSRSDFPQGRRNLIHCGTRDSATTPRPPHAERSASRREEIKTPAGAAGIFPKEAVIVRLVRNLLVEQNHQ